MLAQTAHQSISQGFMGFPYFEKASQVELVGKNQPASAGGIRDRSLILGREDALEEGRVAHPSVLAGESHGQRSLAGYSPRGCKESDMPEMTSKTQGCLLWKSYYLLF